MKLTILALLFSSHLFANDNAQLKSVTGAEAQKLYQGLSGFEYGSGAITAEIEYRLSVKHNDKISCQKESIRYNPRDEFEISYSCEIMP